MDAPTSCCLLDSRQGRLGPAEALTTPYEQKDCGQQDQPGQAQQACHQEQCPVQPRPTSVRPYVPGEEVH